MLITEPMVTCIAFYASFVYAILYLTLEVFPIVFEENRGWSPVVGSLPFIGLFIGVISAVFINLANQPRYSRISDAAHGKPVPEARLAPMAIGGFLFAIGLFVSFYLIHLPRNKISGRLWHADMRHSNTWTVQTSTISKGISTSLVMPKFPMPKSTTLEAP